MWPLNKIVLSEEGFLFIFQIIRVVLDIFRASSLMLFEGAVVAIIKEHGGDYGLQKIFGTMGAVVFGPLSGALIDLEQKKTNYQDNPGTKLSLYKSNEMMMAALKGDDAG